ncbi:hypothetical protein DIPPA_08278 [Diplonema papillatum]|nr:hypothetical protein DIPPA_08278 [Diplonema papillatum]
MPTTGVARYASSSGRVYAATEREEVVLGKSDECYGIWPVSRQEEGDVPFHITPLAPCLSFGSPHHARMPLARHSFRRPQTTNQNQLSLDCLSCSTFPQPHFSANIAVASAMAVLLTTAICLHPNALSTWCLHTRPIHMYGNLVMLSKSRLLLSTRVRHARYNRLSLQNGHQTPLRSARGRPPGSTQRAEKEAPAAAAPRDAKNSNSTNNKSSSSSISNNKNKLWLTVVCPAVNAATAAPLASQAGADAATGDALQRPSVPVCFIRKRRSTISSLAPAVAASLDFSHRQQQQQQPGSGPGGNFPRLASASARKKADPDARAPFFNCTVAAGGEPSRYYGHADLVLPKPPDRPAEKRSVFGICTVRKT